MLTTDDPNFSGRIPPEAHWRSIEFLTGFSCSYAIMLITADSLGFWTDGRYIELAKKHIKLDNVELYNTVEQPSDHYLNWIDEKMPATKVPQLRFAVDGRTLTHEHAEAIRAFFSQAEGRDILWNGDVDPVDEIWEGRPAEFCPKLFDLDLKYCGQGRSEKLLILREKMRGKGCDWYLNTTMDDVAYITNLRGTDAITPMFHAYVLISQDFAGFFCRKEQLSEELTELLSADGYSVCDISALNSMLNELEPGQALLCDKLNDALASGVAPGVRLVSAKDPAAEMKCIKNSKEIECFRKAAVMDGVVLTKAIKKLKDNVASAGYREMDFTPILHELREQWDEFLCEGGPVQLVAYMENAASPHYFPSTQNNSEILPRGVVLFDVGAHFYGATTDVSRTVYLGPCEYDEELIHDYSISLKALITLSRQIFRRGADGACLDTIARSVMWNDLRNYSHGTGHGIGACLNCHEGPQILGLSSYRRQWASSDYPIAPGMIFSNEPGVYRPGKYGIRVENAMLALSFCKNEFGEFCRSETLSLCPFERELIDPEVLSDEDLSWLNDYHAKTYRMLSPYMDEEEKKWLRERTAAISRA